MRFLDDLKYYVELDSHSKGFVGIVNVLLFSSGFHFLCILRLARFVKKIPGAGNVLAKFFSYCGVMVYGCHVSPNASLGARLYFPHPVGIVIGADWTIGNSVTIMQNVTLGKKSPKVQQKSRSIISDRVMVCAGAVIVGEVVIGDGVIVGANSVVINSIGENSLAVGVPAIEKKMVK